MLNDAFNSLLSLHKRVMTLSREEDSIEIEATPSNYSRMTAGPSEMVFEGREFIISTAVLKEPIPRPKRGDRLTDPELGALSVTDAVEMYNLGGAIIAYRVRTD
jgi:hypothetical protein